MFDKKKWFMLVGLFTIFLLILGACSGNKETAKEGDQSENPSSSKEDELKEPKSGGTYTFVYGGDADTLDPHSTSSPATHNFAGLVYNRLVTYETGPENFTNYDVVPDLAEKWDISDDGKVYTFYLRDTQWQDIPPVNGRKLVAEDVVATMERIIKLPGHQAGLLSEVEKIEAKDEKTVVFTLKQPMAPFLNFMANHFMWILPKEGIDGEFDLSTTAIGTGPFILDKWKKNVSVEFVRNPSFYEEGKPYIDKVVWMVVPDQGARIEAFRTGNAEEMGHVSQTEADALLKSRPDTILNENIYPTQTTVFMNMEREPFKDLRVRKAISMAIDRQNAVNQIYGKGEVSSPVNPSQGDWALPLDEREKLQPYDPEKAKQLLAEAGYPDGFDTKIMATDIFGQETVRMAQWVAEDLKAIGINAEIEMVEYATYSTERWPKLNYDIGVGYVTQYQEPDEWLRTQLHSKGSRNWFGINDPELDKMLDEQRLILDQNERKEKIHEIQRYALENVVNPIPLTTHYDKRPQQPYVKNSYRHASYGLLHMKNVWIDK